MQLVLFTFRLPLQISGRDWMSDNIQYSVIITVLATAKLIPSQIQSFLPIGCQINETYSSISLCQGSSVLSAFFCRSCYTKVKGELYILRNRQGYTENNEGIFLNFFMCKVVAFGERSYGDKKKS